MANNQKMRTESDLLGSVELPADVLYGVQTCGVSRTFESANSI